MPLIVSRVFYLFFILCLSFLQSLQAAKTLTTGTFIRDAEIESILHDYIKPLFQTAGLDPTSLNLYVVVNSEINAAASTRYSIFINTGLLLESKNPEQIIGVLAHETGHIAGGHISRFDNLMNKASLSMMASLALGTAAVLAGSPEAGMTTMMGGLAMAQGVVFHYSRGQEGTADSAAVRYLDQLHWSSKGLLEFMQILARQEYLSPDQQDLYLRTHPFGQDRVAFVRHHTQNSPYTEQRLPEDFYLKYDRMMAKLSAYIDPPGKTLLTYKASDTCIKARYARVIALYRSGKLDDSLHQLNTLIQEYPQDAFFHELKGQFLFEQGRLEDALKCYQQALTLNPSAPLIRLSYAQTLLEKKEASQLKTAINELKNILKHEEENAFAWRLLATAYGRQGEQGLSSLALAEETLMLDKPDLALKHAKRAQHHLKSGRDLLRAADIESLASHLSKEKERERR